MTGFLPFQDVLRNAPQPREAAAGTRPGRLFLLDGHALAYRGHFALSQRPLTTSKGQNVSALFVFATTLLRILDAEHPDYLAVAFDPRGKTFRHERYTEYKATRDKTPPEMVELLPAIRELVAGFNAPILEVEGFEADDVIATIAAQAAARGLEVFIVTGDKDFLQIVSPRVKLYNILRTEGEVELQDESTAVEKFGVTSNHVVDLLALMGDSSDNVPGVAGVGKKTAAELITSFGSIENIYQHLDEIKPALRKKLEDGRDSAFLSKELVTLDLAAPIAFDPAACACTGPDVDRLKQLFRTYEMNALMKRISASRHGANDAAVDYGSADDAAAIEAVVAEAAAAERCAIAVIAAAGGRNVAGIALSPTAGRARYVPLGGSARDRLAMLRPLLAAAGRSKPVHDVKRTHLLLLGGGIDAQGLDFDVMIASYCVAPGEYQHDLGSLALKHLNQSLTPLTTLTGTGRAQIDLADAPPDRLAAFACEQADMVGRLVEPLRREMRDAAVEGVFQNIEMPLAAVLEDMERLGIAVDGQVLAELSRDYQQRLDRLTLRIHELAGAEFNINSPKQLGPILFDKLEIHKQGSGKKKPRKTKTGYSTDAEALDLYAGHPLVDAIREYRMLSKLLGTYVDALPRLRDPRTGRIHTSFNQTVAATGRLSSSDPNLQNIPIRTAEGRQIRRAFVAGSADARLLSADYSQVELRIMAHLSGDENLGKAFREGVDVHRWTAGLIFGMDAAEVPPELRARAKTINFGVMYGMGANRLANETGLSFAEATRFIDAYFRTFAGVKAFLDRTVEEARHNGYVTTMLGRRRYIAELDSKHSRVAAAARNAAINTPIQGTAADLIKVAMIRVHARIQREKLASRMLLQVHDELLFEVPEGEIEALRHLAREEMEGAIQLDVPLVVDVGVGRSWLEAH